MGGSVGDQGSRKRKRSNSVCTECRMRSGRCDGERPCSRCQTAGRACSDFSGDNELANLASDTGEGTISIHNHNSNTNTMGVFVSSSIPCTSTVPIYGGYLTPMTAGIAGQDLDAPYDFDPTNVSWESNSLQTPGGTYFSRAHPRTGSWAEN